MNASLVTILVLQWIAIVILAAILFAMVRQVGILHQRVAPAGALMISQGIAIGEKAPVLALKSLDGKDVTIGARASHSTLIMFVAPDCPVCAKLLPALTAIGQQESDWLRIVFASDGKASDHFAFWQQKGLGNYPYVISTELGLSFQISKLPQGVLLDEEGILVAQGLTNSREHVESLFEAKRLKIGTLQDYLASGHALAS